MSKRLFATAFALLLLTVLSPAAFALSYTDDCENTQASDIATYSGFSKFSPITGLGWAGCDDLFSLRVKNDYATATYMVGGAESIRVEILTDMPAYVVNDTKKGYVLGGYPVSALENIIRCRYDRAYDAIFISDSAHDYIVQCENGKPLLVSEDRICDPKSEFYGLNVAVTSGGFEYTKCEDVKLIEVYVPESKAYYRETYLVKIPPGVVGVKLKLNFFSMIYGTDGMDVYGFERNMLLSRVIFSGSRLHMGDAPPPSEPEESKPESSEPDESEPETSKPESSKPEQSKPESSRPEQSKPESSKPEQSKPEPSKPESSRPEPPKPETSYPNPVPPPVLPEIPPEPPVNRSSAFGGGVTETDEEKTSRLKPRGGERQDAEDGQALAENGQGTVRDMYVQDTSGESAYGRANGSAASRMDTAKAGEKNISEENAQNSDDMLLGGGSISAVAVSYIVLSLLLRRRV